MKKRKSARASKGFTYFLSPKEKRDFVVHINGMIKSLQKIKRDVEKRPSHYFFGELL